MTTHIFVVSTEQRSMHVYHTLTLNKPYKSFKRKFFLFPFVHFMQANCSNSFPETCKITKE